MEFLYKAEEKKNMSILQSKYTNVESFYKSWQEIEKTTLWLHILLHSKYSKWTKIVTPKQYKHYCPHCSKVYRQDLVKQSQISIEIWECKELVYKRPMNMKTFLSLQRNTNITLYLQRWNFHHGFKSIRLDGRYSIVEKIQRCYFIQSTESIFGYWFDLVILQTKLLKIFQFIECAIHIFNGPWQFIVTQFSERQW